MGAEVGVDELVYPVSDIITNSINKTYATDTPYGCNAPSGYGSQRAIGFERCKLV
jgi:hypothetical protein